MHNYTLKYRKGMNRRGDESNTKQYSTVVAELGEEYGIGKRDQ
jgi:hypothetical protein